MDPRCAVCYIKRNANLAAKRKGICTEWEWNRRSGVDGWEFVIPCYREEASAAASAGTELGPADQPEEIRAAPNEAV